MDLERVRQEAITTWNKQRKGSVLMISVGLATASFLPPAGSLVLGCIGLLYVAMQPPPSSRSFGFRWIWN